MTWGLALSGGGARGAYTAGVQRYLFTELPKQLGFTPYPDYVSGVSVGAINGYFSATHSDEEIRRMTEIWHNLKIEDMYNLPTGPISFIRNLLQTSQMMALVDTSPFIEFVQKEAARRTIRHSINPKQCKGFLVSATHMYSGRMTTFADVADESIEIAKPYSGMLHYCNIYPEHILASAALPLLFPPVQINNEWYIDGSLRQYVNIRPLQELDVNKIIIIGTRSVEEEYIEAPKDIKPSLTMVGGSSINAMLYDHVERDLATTETINKIIEFGKKEYGDGFEKRLKSQLHVSHTDYLSIRPSICLSKLAYEVFDINKIEADSNTKWFLQWINDSSEELQEASGLSMLLFDTIYTKAAEELGFHDAQNKEDELLEFFSYKADVIP